MAQENDILDMISDGTMNVDDADRLIDGIELAPPITDRLTFLRYMAALRAKWPDEGERKLPNAPVTLRQVIVNACNASRIEWMFNYRRYTNTLTKARASALSAGTTSIAAFHRELNTIFDLVHDMHQATL